MKLERFMRIAELVANTTWVRYYLSSYPGQMVLEIACLDDSDLDSLERDLIDCGLTHLADFKRNGVRCVQYSVCRSY
ncbi:hypothetical protein [Hydrogenophaga sp. NFH-34]|uniref:hypothetical protein n=1 Tax=Hydrogenophaga sp. NFH-34 TaxID=2744446 RepID=UPI001F318CB8|nr:hypothetical protein [Hydrogenophaga sp. NFH-34]